MGKMKRPREKYHLARAKSMNDLTTIEPKVPSLPDYDDLNGSVPQFAISDDLFGGLDIPVNLNRSLPDDTRSVVSTKSSFKDRNLTKKQKREMRHDAFLRKLDVVHQARREATDRKRRQRTPVVGDMQTLADALPSLSHLKKQQVTATKAEPKPKALQKAKVRQFRAMRDMDTFRKVLNDPAYRADPSAAISGYIQDKIRKELMEEA